MYVSMIPLLRRTKKHGGSITSLKSHPVPTVNKRYISFKKVKEFAAKPLSEVYQPNMEQTLSYGYPKSSEATEQAAEVAFFDGGNQPPNLTDPDLNAYELEADYLKERIAEAGEDGDWGEYTDLPEGTTLKDMTYFLGGGKDYIGGYQRGRNEDRFLRSERNYFYNQEYDEEDRIEIRDVWESAKDYTDPRKYHQGFLDEMEKWNPYLVQCYNHSRLLGHTRNQRIKQYLKAKRKFFKERGLPLPKSSTQTKRFDKEHKEMIEHFNVSRYGSVIDTFTMIKETCNSPEMWELYIQSLEFTGNNKDVISNAKDMWTRKIQMSSIVFSKLVKAYVALGLPGRVDLWLRRMKKRNITGTIELYNTLIIKQLKSLPVDLTQVQNIMDEIHALNLVPNVDTMESLMLCYASQDKYDDVKSVHDEFVEKYNVTKGRIGTILMTEYYFFKGDVQTALDHWNLLEKQKLAPRTKTYNLYMQMYLNLDNPKKAEAIYTDMRSSSQRANLSTYKILLHYFANKPDPQGIVFVLSRMTSQKIIPDREFFEICLDGFYKTNLRPEFNDMFKRMLERQMKPSRKYYTMKLELLARRDKMAYVMMIDEIEYMRQAGIEPTKDEIRILINALHSAENPELTQTIYNKYLNKYLGEFDELDHAVLLKTLIENGDLEAASDKFQDIVSKNTTFKDGEVYATIIQYLSMTGQHNEVSTFWNTFKSAIQDNTVNYHPTHIQRVASYISRMGYSVIDTIEDIVIFLRQSKPELLSVDIFETILSLTKRHDYDKTMLYYREMSSNFKLLPSGSIYKSVFESIGQELAETKNLALLKEAWDVMTDAVVNPTMGFLSIDALNQFLIILMKHGSVEVYSYALAWFKKVNKDSANQATLDAVNSTLFKNWMKQSTSIQLVPQAFVERDLQVIYFNVIKSSNIE